MRFRDTQSFGKRQEFIAIATLLAKGCDVYLTLVDDQQIDCVIRDDSGPELTYYDVQVKARSKAAQEKSCATWANLKIARPRKNFIFVFYSEPLDEYWVVPSVFLANNSSQTKSGPYAGHHTVTLARRREGGEPKYTEAFKPFRGAFHLLGALPED